MLPWPDQHVWNERLFYNGIVLLRNTRLLEVSGDVTSIHYKDDWQTTLMRTQDHSATSVVFYRTAHGPDTYADGRRHRAGVDGGGGGTCSRNN